MPRNDRAPSFQFYPGDWLSDPAVHALTFDQQGRYFWALCMSWQTPTPGLATEDQWRRWMRYSDARWASVRDRHAACFAVRDDGTWAQKRTLEVRAAQEVRYNASSSGARATNVKRWGTTQGGSHSDTLPSRYPVSPSSSSSSSVYTPPPPPAGGARDWFTKCQDDYPRKGGSPTEARTAFDSALERHPGKIDAEDLANAARSYAARCRADGIEPSRCPSLRRWLTRDEFLIEFSDKPPPPRAKIDLGEPADPDTAAEGFREIFKKLS